MTHRDEVTRALGGHDPGDPGGAQHVAFGRIAGTDRCERRRVHSDPARRHRQPLRFRLGADIDHARVAVIIDVGEGLAHVQLPQLPVSRRHCLRLVCLMRIFAVWSRVIIASP